MSTRISSLTALLLLAACHAPSQTTVAKQTIIADDAAADDAHIDCAHGDAPFRRDCTVDRLQGDSGLILTLRHPDGGFHRLLVTKDGRGVVAADGAERAVVTIDGADLIGVAIGGDHYRLPATVRAKPGA